VDTWGVDFALLDSNDMLLGNPHSYRDQRTHGMVEAVGSLISPFDVFLQTGNQNMAINSLYQLFAMKLAGSCQLAEAKTFLNLPDLFNFWFSGRKASEFTIASTTQCFNLNNNDWARELLEKVGISADIFPKIIQPGTIVGELSDDLSDEFPSRI
jgi:sugar (pentulose or hexulose) kinase